MAETNNSNDFSNRKNFKSSYVTFRLLCHASRVGAFIGRSGTGIKSLQQHTNAKIRVEDSPHESPERVIRVLTKLDGDDDGHHREVSKAQEALLKVFERVLDVTAESNGIDVGDMVVSCRLLANVGQAGSVIGKGGKVVEKIRNDTGCRIRVLNDKLPACTESSDEIIEIQGHASSVKKALIAVAGRLQDCPPFDRTKLMGSRPYEVVRSETSAVLHGGSTMRIGSNAKTSEVLPFSAEANRVSAQDLKAPQQEITFRIICSSDRVGAVIGKGGKIVSAIENETGAIISFVPSVVDCEDRLVTITALENPESRYSPAQKAVMLVFAKSVEVGADKVPDLGPNNKLSVTAQLVVPVNHVGCLLGKGGAIVTEMRNATGTSIMITGNDQVPKCVMPDKDKVMHISGEYSNVRDALYNATGRLRDQLIVSTKNNGGTRTYGRPRDSIPLGGQPAVAVSHGLDIHSLSQGIDHLKLSQGHSLPGFLVPKVVGAINSRDINDVGRRLTSHKGGLDLVSGTKSAIVSNTTVEIVVRGDVIGSVEGENGNNLVQLREISGAKVIVQDPQTGTDDRTIIISGTPDETQIAQSLLQAFILNGSSTSPS